MRGETPEFQRRLLSWFLANKRALPWRVEPTLYKTVVSEFMLQQTQVKTVIPYFERWMQVFPDFQSLAEANEEHVLKLWEGLGYYSRARNLKKLAESIVLEGPPGTSLEWRKLPGIGPYTAAAVCSIAFGEPDPVIDGNVIRVLSRLNRDDRPIQSSAEAMRRFRPLARLLIHPDQPGNFNEAIMELGATICKKSRPACLLCPVNRHCEAHHKGDPEAFPVIPGKTIVHREVHRLYCHKEGMILLSLIPSRASRLRGLAELPELPSKPATNPIMIRKRGISNEQITENIYQLDPSHQDAENCARRKGNRWVSLEELQGLTLSGPHRRWLEELIGRAAL